jgi:hypothetical protein
MAWSRIYGGTIFSRGSATQESEHHHQPAPSSRLEVRHVCPPRVPRRVLGGSGTSQVSPWTTGVLEWFERPGCGDDLSRQAAHDKAAAALGWLAKRASKT